MPGFRSVIFSTPSWKVAVLNSGRGSRPGFSSSAMMSVTVGMPKVSSANCAGFSDFRNALSPMIDFSGRLVAAEIFSTTG